MAYYGAFHDNNEKEYQEYLLIRERSKPRINFYIFARDRAADLQIQITNLLTQQKSLPPDSQEYLSIQEKINELTKTMHEFESWLKPDENLIADKYHSLNKIIIKFSFMGIIFIILALIFIK